MLVRAGFFLPAGFPDSVAADYLPYQLWAVPCHVTGWMASSLATSSLLQARRAPRSMRLHRCMPCCWLVQAPGLNNTRMQMASPWRRSTLCVGSVSSRRTVMHLPLAGRGDWQRRCRSGVGDGRHQVDHQGCCGRGRAFAGALPVAVPKGHGAGS